MPKKIYVLSDQAIHWNIVPWSKGKNVYLEAWGYKSINKLLGCLQSFFHQISVPVDWELMKTGLEYEDTQSINPTNHTVNHAFATWRQYNDGSSKAWRIQEIVHVGQSVQPQIDQAVFSRIKEADLVIFQDWGMNIRYFDIPGLNSLLKDKWFIYRAYPPVFEDKLWHELQKGLGKKNILIIRANDLRTMNTSISKGLSWEQTIQDIASEIYFKRAISLHPLRTAEYVLISFGCTGTLLIHNHLDRGGENPEFQFFFDSMGGEGYWEKSHPGYLPGDLDLLFGLVAREILYPDIASDIRLDRAIRAHLMARRMLITTGANVEEGSLSYSCLPEEFMKVYGPKQTQEFSPVSFDSSVFKSMYERKQNHQESAIEDWSLLGMTKWDLYSLARQIALFGPMKALQGWNIPIARFNLLLTVDRKEIEFLHHLKSLISEYLQNKISQPLSIAVFGAPGSGKSFNIKQLAKSLDLPDQEIKDITFNLSQFNVDDPSELYQAFHAVRDISLSGKTPLVFWDEFDSKHLAWLRYFLAPMQDGEFQEGQLIHNIGKSIFVFAGGTCSCMEEFEDIARDAVSDKGPDFLSRIKGFINIMGPNPMLGYTDRKKANLKPGDEAAELILARNADPEFIIRRAILINSLLYLSFKQLFKNNMLQIDDGVLNAFLLVPRFKHGTRSMETIFKTSQLYGKDKYHRSDLPPESQMNLHVDGQQFYELLSQEPRKYEGGEAFYHLVNEITFDEKIVEKLAVGIHSIYSLVTTTGRLSNPLSITQEEFNTWYDQMQKLPDELPHDEVSQNYHNARKIPEKLTSVGFTIVPLEADIPAGVFDAEEFEKVSQLEHIRWVRHYIDAGWAYSPHKQKMNKLHDALVAWDEAERQKAEEVYGKNYVMKMGIAKGEMLSEDYRNMDRVISLAIPWILEKVGYKMVRLKHK